MRIEFPDMRTARHPPISVSVLKVARLAVGTSRSLTAITPQPFLFLDSVTAKEARPKTGAIAHFGAGAVTATPARNNKHSEISPSSVVYFLKALLSWSHEPESK